MDNSRFYLVSDTELDGPTGCGDDLSFLHKKSLQRVTSFTLGNSQEPTSPGRCFFQSLELTFILVVIALRISRIPSLVHSNKSVKMFTYFAPVL